LRLNRGDNTIATETKVRVAVGLAFAFIVLNVSDILLTWQCLWLGAIEANLFIKPVLELGFFSSISFKLGSSSGIAAIMLHKGRLSWLVIAVIMFSFVCALNMITLANLS
jgi:hypothetical protein